MVTEKRNFPIKADGTEKNITITADLRLPEATWLPDGRNLIEVLADLEKRVTRVELPGGELTANDN